MNRLKARFQIEGITIDEISNAKSASVSFYEGQPAMVTVITKQGKKKVFNELKSLSPQDSEEVEG